MSRYRYVDIPTSHPLATGNRNRSGNLTKIAEHRIVLYDKIGPGVHPCHWCGRVVVWAPDQGVGGDRLSTDHLDGDRRNNDPANLVPSCHGCNSTRSTRVRDDEPHIKTTRGRLRGVLRICRQCDVEFIADPHELRRGRGLYCSKSCASRWARLH